MSPTRRVAVVGRGVGGLTVGIVGIALRRLVVDEAVPGIHAHDVEEDLAKTNADSGAVSTSEDEAGTAPHVATMFIATDDCGDGGSR